MTIIVDSPVVQQFIDALHSVDSARSTEAMTALIAPDAPVDSIDGHGTRRGPAGIEALFTQYLAQLAEVETTFTRVTETSDRAALEWSSEVRLTGGQPTTYTGVSIVEFTTEVITSFATVYDSGALLLPPADEHPRTASGAKGADDDTGSGGNSGDTQGEGAAGYYNADSGFLPQADRDAATGQHR